MVQEQILPAIIVEIDPVRSFACEPLSPCNPRSLGNLFKRSIAPIAVQTIRLFLTSKKNVEPFVVIEFGPRG